MIKNFFIKIWRYILSKLTELDIKIPHFTVDNSKYPEAPEFSNITIGNLIVNLEGEGVDTSNQRIHIKTYGSFQYKPSNALNPNDFTVIINGEPTDIDCRNIELAEIGDEWWVDDGEKFYIKDDAPLYDIIIQRKDLKTPFLGYIEGRQYSDIFNSDYRTIVEIVEPLPLFYNAEKTDVLYDFSYGFDNHEFLKNVPSDLLINNPQITSVNSLFSQCSSLKSIPDGLFDNTPDLLDIRLLFYDCQSLSSVPENLFANNFQITNAYKVFGGCTSMKNFSLKFGSPNIGFSFYSFYGSSNYTSTGFHCTVYVPYGSESEKNFKIVAADTGYENITVKTY